jgi:glycosyltransferase involved in cell wall biosynthesis
VTAVVFVASSGETPEVSIIIPVFNQRRELLSCLQALHGQTCRPGRFEVVVVDNGSDPPIGNLSLLFSFVRCIREPKPGSYAARNRGIEGSRADLLGFTDADCLPAPDWIERGMHGVENLPGRGMIAGKVDLTFHDPATLTTAELFESVFGFPQKTYVEWGFAATANLFTTRSVFDTVGLFDERLVSGGDLEWGQRLHSRALAQVYAGDVRVSHAARHTLGQLLRKSLRVARGMQQVADLRGQGTTGLLAHARRQLVQLRRIRANLSHERLDTLSKKVRFGAAVWLVDLLQTSERYRVHYCGTARRI